VHRSLILIGAAVAVAAAVAFAWYAPTVLVAAPLWVMALCVITGCRSAPDGQRRSAARPADLADRRESLRVLPGRRAG
jgi:hypothetical protein